MKININVAIASVALILNACGPSREKIEQEKQAIADITLSEPAMCAPPSADYNNLQEEYSQHAESGYKPVKHYPYSTFSIDVDAASYSMMRRMILDGNLPPKEMIRIEEWVNYFDYNYPTPTNNDPFNIITEIGNCPWNKNHQLLMIGLKGREIKQKDAPPNHLVFLIDVSGSMQDPNKLPLLKKSFRLLLNNLRETDRLSLVVYAGASGVVFENKSLKHKSEILEAINALGANGSTAGGEGIELAYKIAEENFNKKGNNRIILATDGDFNVGVSSEKDLETLITTKRDKGIYLSVLGFGEGNLKDNKMEILADKGNGNYYYIDNILEAQKVLVNQVGGTLQTIAKDVKIQLEFNPHFVKEYRLIGYDNRRLTDEEFNDDVKDAGELGAGHSVTALYEIIPANSEETTSNIDNTKYQSSNTTNSFNDEFANIKLRYKLPGKNNQSSILITHAAANNEKAVPSENFKLVCAVTQFGLLLSESDYRGRASFGEAITLASAYLPNDKEGYVAELINLIKTAKNLQEKDKDLTE